jgi:hypothetical protein
MRVSTEKDPLIVENDKLQEIMSKMRQVQTGLHEPASLRSSTESSRLPLSETMLVDAVADVFLNQLQGARNPGPPSVDNSFEYRRIGEEMIIDKLKGIFDEVAATHQPEP